MRHSPLVTENDPGRGVSITTHSRDYPRTAHIALHSHGSDQLVYASRGAMEIASGENLWVLPPHFGLWIPAHTAHSIRMPERVSMRTLYLQPGIHKMWTNCTVFHVAPLLRELIFEIVRMGNLRVRSRVDCALREILVSQLRRATPVPSGVTLPQDQRARAVASVILSDPAFRSSLNALCKRAGASIRTIQRIYKSEVGLDFESWRRQVRLMKAVHLLLSGLSVKEVAYAVGYREASTFIELFRSTFGRTPRSWIGELSTLSTQIESAPR